METTIEERWNGNTVDRRFGTETWPRLLGSPSDIPDGFRSDFPDVESGFPYTVLLPEEKGIVFKTRPARLVAAGTDSVAYLERAGSGGVKKTIVPFADVTVLTHGKNLLQSRLTIGGERALFTIRYNTVAEHLFEPIVSRVRGFFRGCGEAQYSGLAVPESERGKFLRLMERDYRYMNYGANRIFPGDTVECLAHQPTARFRSIALFGFKLASWDLTSHIAFLTDRELCLIQEEHQLRSPGMPSYGSAEYFVPLKEILGISVGPAKARGFSRLSIGTKAGTTASALISDENPEFETLLALIEERGIGVERRQPIRL